MCFVLCQGFRASLTSPIEVQVLKRFFLVEFDVAKIQCERALVNSFTLISYFLISLIINALVF